jgi:hypothetical protein
VALDNLQQTEISEFSEQLIFIDSRQTIVRTSDIVKVYNIIR